MISKANSQLFLQGISWQYALCLLIVCRLLVFSVNGKNGEKYAFASNWRLFAGIFFGACI